MFSNVLKKNSKKNLDYDDSINIETNKDFSLKNIKYGLKFGVNNLEFLETIGLGTVGRTRLVKCHVDNKYYALKMMKKMNIVELDQIKHLLSEINILSRIRNCFVPELYAVFQDENTVYILSEYIPGGELFSHLRRQQVFDRLAYLFYAVEIASCLNYLHELNIVYRGLKPENIGITGSGHIRLNDFSFAKVLSTGRTFTQCGTPEYCSPEILNSRGYGRASDWWAFGVLIFEMAYGFPCFYGENTFTVYQRIIEGVVVFPIEKPIPLQDQDIIRKLLVNDRSNRLGCGKAGFKGLKGHAFFAHIDWNSAASELISPPVIPTVKNIPGDTSNYDYYVEDDSEVMNDMTEVERKSFEEIDGVLNRIPLEKK